MRAANHTRLCADYSQAGVELFVYGDDLSNKAAGPKKYPARQTLPASQAIARSHGLNPDKVVFARQNPDAIDQGVFHNDVIAVGNQDLLFHHEMAFADTQSVYTQLNTALDSELQVIAVPADAVSWKMPFVPICSILSCSLFPVSRVRSLLFRWNVERCHQYMNI